MIMMFCIPVWPFTSALRFYSTLGAFVSQTDLRSRAVFVIRSPYVKMPCSNDDSHLTSLH